MAGFLPDTVTLRGQSPQPSDTWGIDWEQGRLSGMIDGTDALRQAVLLALMTPRFAHVIYSFQYGSELENLIGKSVPYAEAAAPALAEEAVRMDDRVKVVKAGRFVRDGGSLSGTLEIRTAGGNLPFSVSIGRKGKINADSKL